MKKNILVVFMFSFLTVSPSVHGSQYPQNLLKEEKQASLWLAEIDKKISRQEQNRKIPAVQLEGNENVICSLYVSKNGQIEHPHIDKSSGSIEVDKDLLELVCGAAPFNNPPDTLALRRAVLIDFTTKGHSVRFSTNPRLLNATVGQFK
jgi:outer membrane biosynthesis protein TonB